MNFWEEFSTGSHCMGKSIKLFFHKCLAGNGSVKVETVILVVSGKGDKQV